MLKVLTVSAVSIVLTFGVAITPASATEPIGAQSTGTGTAIAGSVAAGLSGSTDIVLHVDAPIVHTDGNNPVDH